MQLSTAAKSKKHPSLGAVVVTPDGQRFDLGFQKPGHPLNWYYKWRQDRKIAAYCLARLSDLTGAEREDFAAEVAKMKEARRG